jgi:hypothetical protein
MKETVQRWEDLFGLMVFKVSDHDHLALLLWAYDEAKQHGREGNSRTELRWQRSREEEGAQDEIQCPRICPQGPTFSNLAPPPEVSTTSQIMPSYLLDSIPMESVVKSSMKLEPS